MGIATGNTFDERLSLQIEAVGRAIWNVMSKRYSTGDGFQCIPGNGMAKMYRRGPWPTYESLGSVKTVLDIYEDDCEPGLFVKIFNDRLVEVLMKLDHEAGEEVRKSWNHPISGKPNFRQVRDCDIHPLMMSIARKIRDIIYEDYWDISLPRVGFAYFYHNYGLTLEQWRRLIDEHPWLEHSEMLLHTYRDLLEKCILAWDGTILGEGHGLLLGFNTTECSTCGADDAVILLYFDPTEKLNQRQSVIICPNCGLKPPVPFSYPDCKTSAT